tara:strand:+ start:32251 stop:32724 length:474 start_codon:yes stop_codon:yes gene_type:complete
MFLLLKRLLLLYFSAQFIKFVFAGGLGAFSNWSTRLFIRNLVGLDFLESTLIAYVVGLIVAFFLYRKYVFPYSYLTFKTQSIRFLIINLSFLPVMVFLLSFFTGIFLSLGLTSFSEPLAHAFSLGLPALVTFFLYKFIAFVGKNESIKDFFKINDKN